MTRTEGRIPVKSTWCHYCHSWDEVTSKLRFDGHCAQHPEGRDYDAAKRDAYEPSPFVLETVGRVFQGPFADGVYYCYGYDPRCGFFVRNVADPTDVRNLSERAIGRTFHQMRVYGIDLPDKDSVKKWLSHAYPVNTQ